MLRTLRATALVLALLLLAGACTAAEDDPVDSASDQTSDDRPDDRDDESDDREDEQDDTDDESDDTDEPTFTEGECPDDIIGFDAEDEDAVCGTVTVPENRDEPEGTEVVLPVMLLPATGSNPEPDPILYLEGGPGGAGFDNASVFASVSWRVDRDIILYEQRGTGRATPLLNCDEMDERLEEFFPLESDSPEAEALDEELFTACRDDLLDEGIDLDAYNSAASAQDVADLRVALGDEFGFDEWNLLGISYGTRLALTVLRDAPEGVRSVIIDSVYPPAADGTAELAPNAQKAFDVFFDRCASDPDCAGPYPDLEQRFYALVDALEADPVMVEAEAMQSDLGGEVLVDGDSLVGGVFQLLYITSVIPMIPVMLTRMEEGDFTFFASLMLELAAFQRDSLAQGMYYSVQCREEIPFTDRELAASNLAPLNPVVARTFGPEQDFEDCETWGVTPADEIETEPVTSDVPSLVMAGGFDPITPISYAELAASTLANHWLVVVQGAGHGVSLETCGERIVGNFLDDLDEDPNEPCADDIDSIRWQRTLAGF